MRPPTPFSNWLPYLLIALVWLLTRVYPLSTTEPLTYWEVGEAKKLLEYGFSARSGAIINNFYMTGMVSEPWKYNYVNHPYPFLWFDTLVYAFAGGWGVILANGLIGLAASLLVLPALQTLYPPRLALLGAILFTLAPSAIVFTFDTNIVQLGAVLWPPAIYLIGKHLGQRKAVTAALLGVTVFLCGQIAWFTYSVLPALLCAACALAYHRTEGFTLRPDKGLITAIIVGGALTLAVFVGQIVFYTYRLSDTLAYLHGQAGLEQGVPLGQMYLAITLRSLLSVGPALLLGSAAGVVCLARARSMNWLQSSALLYPLLFAGAVLALPRFFFRERTMYQYLLFPCTVLTLTALQHIGSRLVTNGIICLAVLGLAYPAFQASIPKVSETSRKLGAVIHQISQPDEVVATNLETQQRPFQTWDVGSIQVSSLIADRMLREKITSREGLQHLLKSYISKELKVVFLYDAGRPIDDSLLSFLRAAAAPESVRFDVPIEPPSAATRLRSYYWKIAGKHQATGPVEDKGAGEQFEVFRFKLSEPASLSDGEHSL